MRTIRLGLAVAAFGVPLVTVAVRRGNLSWSVIRDELRLRPMDRQQWLFTLLSILVGAFIGTSVLGIT